MTVDRNTGDHPAGDGRVGERHAEDAKTAGDTNATEARTAPGNLDTSSRTLPSRGRWEERSPQDTPDTPVTLRTPETRATRSVMVARVPTARMRLAEVRDVAWKKCQIAWGTWRAWKARERVTPSRSAPIRRIAVAGLVCFGLWLLLDAHTLERAALASPLGARRSVSVTVLRPLSWLAGHTGLSEIVTSAHDAMGRHGVSGVQLIAKGPISVPKGSHLPGPPPDFLEHLPGPRSASSTPAPQPVYVHPTASNPLRVLIIGDSIGEDLGYSLVNDLAATDAVGAILDAHVDTGLSRPDYFNWPAELNADMVKYAPQVVVVMIGGNDAQNFIVNNQVMTVGTASWVAAYGQRAALMMTEATSRGAQVIWVGMPSMADPTLSADMKMIDNIDRAQSILHPGVTYVSSTAVLCGPGGQYEEYLTTPSGTEIEVRTPDGVHLASGGSEIVARRVMAVMRSRLHIILPG